jgi:ferrous iron transport protein A
MRCKVRDLRVGDTAVVAGYETGDRVYRSRLLAMGLTRGTTVKVLKVAPLGDPLELEVRGFSLSLRRAEAGILIVESAGR